MPSNPAVAPNMGLSLWDKPGVPYSYSQLWNNFSAIDSHDHTPGRGVQIPSDGIKDNAITTSKIVNNSVTGVKIPNNAIEGVHIQNDSIENRHMTDGSIGTDELQDESVTSDKLAATARVPLGTVVAWYRANTSIGIPEGWAVCDGVAWNNTPNDMGLSSGFKPNLSNRFILGSSEGASTHNPSTAPPELSTGGSHVRDLQHVHTVPPHTHTVPDHQHGIHPVSDVHNHRFWTWVSASNSWELTHLHQRTTARPTSEGVRQSAYAPFMNQNSEISDDVEFQMGPPDYGSRDSTQHNHGGLTTGSGTFSTGANTGSGTTGGAQSQDLSGVDIRPSFVGLLYIMKVRN